MFLLQWNQAIALCGILAESECQLFAARYNIIYPPQLAAERVNSLVGNM